MIEILRDESGKIKAVCEWLVFDVEGRLNDDGAIIVIMELFIEPEYQNNGVIQTIEGILLEKNPQMTHCTWQRETKYGKDKKPSLYRREQFKEKS